MFSVPKSRGDHLQLAMRTMQKIWPEFSGDTTVSRLVLHFRASDFEALKTEILMARAVVYAEV